MKNLISHSPSEVGAFEMGMCSSPALALALVAAPGLLLILAPRAGALLSKLAGEESDVTTEVRDSISILAGVGLIGCGSSERFLRRSARPQPEPAELRRLLSEARRWPRQKKRRHQSAAGSSQPRQQQKSKRKIPRRKPPPAWPSV